MDTITPRIVSKKCDANLQSKLLLYSERDPFSRYKNKAQPSQTTWIRSSLNPKSHCPRGRSNSFQLMLYAGISWILESKLKGDQLKNGVSLTHLPSP